MEPVVISTYIVKLSRLDVGSERVAIPMPARYKVLKAVCSSKRLGLRVRQMGPVHTQKLFLIMRDECLFPNVLLRPHDPSNSEDLQWSFWQGLRVGGDMEYDVFDVTHLLLEGFDKLPAASPDA